MGSATGYVLLYLLYPTELARFVVLEPIAAAIWLSIGVAAWLVCIRYRWVVLNKAWFALWFLPAVANVFDKEVAVPWPIAMLGLGQLTTHTSLAVCLLCNFVIVFSLAWLITSLRRNRAKH